MPNFKRKQKLVNDFGSKCQRCGYNKCLRALHFHHIDSSEKYLWMNDKFHTSLNEVEKHPERFNLVCANCHAELHDEETRKQYNYEICQNCGKEFRSDKHRQSIGRGKFCSKKCQQNKRDQWAQSEESLIKRLLKRTIKNPEGSTCWIWSGALFQGKFPQLMTKQPNGKYTLKGGHRVSYEHYVGLIPKGGQVIRTCNNPRCVNPDHLKLK